MILVVKYMNYNVSICVNIIYSKLRLVQLPFLFILTELPEQTVFGHVLMLQSSGLWPDMGTGSLLHDNYCSAYTGILMQNLESAILLKLHWSATHPSSVLDRFVSPLTWFGLLKSLASCVVEMEIHQTLSQEVHQR